ncbi:hypothetical protein [Mycobacterium sp. 236(2023)]|uniref:hypothetical protein n=1 Tax=Mycobacterium sp. 236(2023) TaxID=3038163 RepID=UPI002415283A|nr:hypothetical protein [Mycobacterium sp. 236(2023)]MDG4669186.1 hypothetical protein [Mycobacterium sp. 236(2023)]
MSQPAPLYVAAVELPSECVYSNRWFNGGGQPSDTYPIRVGFSRSVNDFEIVLLGRYGYQVLLDVPYARGWALKTSSIDAVASNIQRWDRELADAAQQAHKAAQHAQAKTEHELSLVSQINEQLKQSVPDRYKP